MMPNGSFKIADAVVAAGKLTPSRPPLHQRAEQVNEALETLDAVLAGLRDRLEPVLQPNTPSGEPVDARLQGGDDSWLAEWLTGTAARVEASTAAVRRLIDRIDL